MELWYIKSIYYSFIIHFFYVFLYAHLDFCVLLAVWYNFGDIIFFGWSHEVYIKESFANSIFELLERGETLVQCKTANILSQISIINVSFFIPAPQQKDQKNYDEVSSKFLANSADF